MIRSMFSPSAMSSTPGSCYPRHCRSYLASCAYIYILLTRLCVHTIHNSEGTRGTSRPRRPTNSSLNYQVHLWPGTEDLNSDRLRTTRYSTWPDTERGICNQTSVNRFEGLHTVTDYCGYRKKRPVLLLPYRPSVPPIAVLNEESVFNARLSI